MPHSWKPNPDTKPVKGVFQDWVDGQTTKLDRLKPEKFPEFVKYYFGLDMGGCHKEWFTKYIFNYNIRRLLMQAPMGHAKSTYIGIIYPIWRLCNDPRWRILLGGASLERSTDLLRSISEHLENNDRLISDFGPFKPKDPAKWTEKVKYISSAERFGHPTLRATAVEANTAGMRCDEFIGDDLVSLENSATEMQRHKLKRWFDLIALTRIEPWGVARVIGTEYGEQTLYQDIIKKIRGQYTDWTTVVYRAIDPSNKGKNQELWEEYWPIDRLEMKKREITEIGFELAFQNNPRALSGKIFKHDWLQYYEKAPENLVMFQGVDLAISELETADFFVIMTIGIDPKSENIYIIDIFREHISFGEQVDIIKAKAAEYAPKGIGIESVAYQRAMPQNLRGMAALPLKEIHSTTNKALRMLALVYYFQNKKVFIKQDMMKFLNEYLSYDPDGGKSPDQLDALDFALQVGLGRMHKKFLTYAPGESRKPVWG